MRHADGACRSRLARGPLRFECAGGVDQVEATFTASGEIDTLAVKPWANGGRWFDVDEDGVSLSDRGGRLDDVSTPLRYVGDVNGLLRRRATMPGDTHPVTRAVLMLVQAQQ